MSDEYRVRNIDLDKLANHVRSAGQCTEESALHLMDTIRVLRNDLQYERDTVQGLAAANTSQAQRLEELEELISTDLSIKELHVVPGRMDLSATHPLAAAVTASLVSVFKSAGAENYFEMEAYREDVGPIVITIQRREGKTPGRIAQELRDELKRLKESV